MPSRSSYQPGPVSSGDSRIDTFPTFERVIVKGYLRTLSFASETPVAHGASKGQMLAAMQHRGTMRNGDYGMDVTVVPDSGTGKLAGMEGAMTILIKGSQHEYEFEYTLG